MKKHISHRFLIVFLFLSVLNFTSSLKARNWFQYQEEHSIHDQTEFKKLLEIKWQDLPLSEKKQVLSHAQNFLKTLKSPLHLAYCHELIGKLYFDQKEFLLALNHFNQSLEGFKKEGMMREYVEVNTLVGSIFYEIGEFSKAIDIYLNVLKYYEKESDYYKIVELNNKIGVLFHRNSNSDKALEYYQKASELLDEKKDTTSELYARLLTNLGLSYIELNFFEKAKECFEKSIQVNKHLNISKIHTVNLGNLGIAHSSLEDYIRGEKFFREAIAESYLYDDSISVAINQGDIGFMYYKMALNPKYRYQKKILIDKSIKNTELALDALKVKGDLRRVQALLKQLSDIYALKGNVEKSFALYKNYIVFKDSVFNVQSANEIARKEMAFIFSKREDSIRIHNEREIEVKDALLIASKNEKWMLTIGIFLLSIIGLMLYYQNCHRKKVNKKLSLLNQELEHANQIKARFFTILNHDLRSPISNIVNFIYLRKEAVNQLDKMTIERLESQMTTSVENLLESMEDMLIWSKGQMKNFQPEIKEIEIKNVFESIRSFYQNIDNVSIEFENSQKLKLWTDENYLKTILRNLTSNAIKAMGQVSQPRIIWRAKQMNDLIIISIYDNGIGGEKESFRALYDDNHVIGIKSGLGLHLVRDMAHAIHCSVEVFSEVGQGTRVDLIFEK